MGLSRGVICKSHLTKHYSAMIPTEDTTVQKYSLYYWHSSFKIRSCPITPKSRHLRDFWFLNVTAHVFKLIILTQLMLSSKWKLRFCCTSQEVRVCKGKTPDCMAYHKNHFAATVLSLCTYALISGLVTCDQQHRNDTIYSLIHTMVSKNVQSSQVKGLAPSVFFLVSYREISNALSGQLLQVHKMISHINRTSSYSSRKDSSLSF